MRGIKTKVYKYDELTESAKENAIEDLYDINVDHEWYEHIYDDAERIGLKLTGFDLDGGNYCSGDAVITANEIAANIFRDHGTHCETYKTAADFMEKWQPVFDKYMQDDLTESQDCEDDLIELEADFLKSLLEDYRIILSKEYDYLTGEEAIKETIQANEYEFTEGGKLI